MKVSIVRLVHITSSFPMTQTIGDCHVAVHKMGTPRIAVGLPLLLH
jgi:hypothetical protein